MMTKKQNYQWFQLKLQLLPSIRNKKGGIKAIIIMKTKLKIKKIRNTFRAKWQSKKLSLLKKIRRHKSHSKFMTMTSQKSNNLKMSTMKTFKLKKRKLHCQPIRKKRQITKYLQLWVSLHSIKKKQSNPKPIKIGIILAIACVLMTEHWFLGQESKVCRMQNRITLILSM